jgi:hypothetical protein
MLHTITLVDLFDLGGLLQTTRIISDQNEVKPIPGDDGVDSQDEMKEHDEDRGGFGICNLPGCKVSTVEKQMKNFTSETDFLEFQIEHLMIPLFPKSNQTVGYYHLLLPVNFELTELLCGNPTVIPGSDEVLPGYAFDIFWDKTCRMHMLKLTFEAENGWASFMIRGKAKLFLKENLVPTFRDVKVSDDIIGQIDIGDHDKQAKEIVLRNLCRKIDWLNVKPNFFGLPLNNRWMIEKAINHLQERLQKHA